MMQLIQNWINKVFFGCGYGNNNNTTIIMNNILFVCQLFFDVAAMEYKFIIIIDYVTDCGDPTTIECEFIIHDEYLDLNDVRDETSKNHILQLLLAVMINSADLVTMRTDIGNKMKNSCDGYGTFNVMTSAVNIFNNSSRLMLFLHAIIIVFDGMDLQMDKLHAFECTCGNISISIIGNNFNRIRITPIIATLYDKLVMVYKMDQVYQIDNVIRTLNPIIQLYIRSYWCLNPCSRIQTH